MKEKIKKFEEINHRKRKDFIEQISNLCEGLFYISETDAELLLFEGGNAEAATAEVLLQQTGDAPDTLVEQRDATDFFARLTKVQDWFSDKQRERAGKFSELDKLLKENLRDVKVFRIGRIQIDIYIVGMDAENNMVGVKTKAVET